MSANRFIVLCGQIVGNWQDGFEIVYNFDGEIFSDRDLAIKHGLEIRESDDFNIGVIKGKKLVSLDWMKRPVDTDAVLLNRISTQLNLKAWLP